MRRRRVSAGTLDVGPRTAWGLVVLVPKSYAPFGEIIRSELDTHPIAGKYADAMLTHLAVHIGDDVMPIAQSDDEPSVRQHFADDTLHLDHLFFSHEVVALRNAEEFSDGAQIGCGDLAVVATLYIEGDLLIFLQGGQPRTLDGGDVHEHILRAVVGLDETKTFGGIKKLHGARCH